MIPGCLSEMRRPFSPVIRLPPSHTLSGKCCVSHVRWKVISLVTIKTFFFSFFYDMWDLRSRVYVDLMEMDLIFCVRLILIEIFLFLTSSTIAMILSGPYRQIHTALCVDCSHRWGCYGLSHAASLGLTLARLLWAKFGL